jgi:hypothetical protein
MNTFCFLIRRFMLMSSKNSFTRLSARIFLENRLTVALIADLAVFAVAQLRLGSRRAVRSAEGVGLILIGFYELGVRGFTGHRALWC